ncbi:MAG TPA: penicillin-binding protein activator [Vicinamibacterales bacterium]|nr:penicillin-binding protein activator [Vicinamibacterales bacterium]
MHLPLMRCVVVLLVAAFGWSCGDDRPMGVLLPTTGEAEAYGRSVEDGIKLAVAEARTRALVPADFTVLEADTGSLGKRAAEALQRMVDEHDVAIVVGGVTTDEAEALIPVVEENHVICLSPCAPANTLTGRSRYFFRLFATDEVEGSTAARYLYKEQSVRKVVVITDDSVFTRGIETEFRQHFELKLGGEIVGTVHTGADNWQRKLGDAIHAHGAQAVYIVGHGERTLEVLQHLEERRFNGVKVTTSSLYLSHVVSGGGSAAEGVVFPLVAFDQASTKPPVRAFVESFENRYGGPPDIYAAHGYDAMRVALRAMVEARRPHASQIRRVMTIGLRDFTGVTGAVAFDERGDVPRYPVMHQIWNGRVVSCSWLRQRRDATRREIFEGLRRAPTPRT